MVKKAFANGRVVKVWLPALVTLDPSTGELDIDLSGVDNNVRVAQDHEIKRVIRLAQAR
jgi:hypothetical protein